MPFVGIGVGIGRQRFRGGFVGLLDEYSGAAAAYSLRQLSSTYTGDAIRVRRASDNTELNIGFVNNELDTASLTTFCSGTDGFVTTWYDQSGNAVDATQATAANQPQIVSSGSVILDGGKPSIKFDGTDDFMDFATTQGTIKSTFLAANIVSNTTSRQRIFEELRFNGVANNAGYIIHQDGSQINDPLQIQIFNDGLTQISYNNPTLGHVLIGAIINVGSQNLYLNNIEVATGVATMKSNFTQGKMSFATSPANGNYQELIIYNTDESINRTPISDNINSYYGIY